MALLSSLLAVTMVSSSAVGNSSSSELTATALISLYKEAKADLLNTLNTYFNASTTLSGGGATANVNTTAVNATININSTTTVETTAVNINMSATESLEGMNGTLSTKMALGHTNSSLCSNIYNITLSYVRQADQYIEAAEANIEAGNYNMAAHQALKALNILGKAYVHLTHCIAQSQAQKPMNNSLRNVNVTGPNSSHIAAGLMSAILRHEIRLSRLRAALQEANNSGINVSSAWNFLSQAQDLLSKARDLVMEGNSSAASNIMAEANRIMAQIVRTLKAGSIEAIKHGKWHVRGNKSLTINMSEQHVHHGQNKSRNVTWRGNHTTEAGGKARGHRGNALKPTFTARGNHSRGRNNNGSIWGNENEEGHERFNKNGSMERNRPMP